MEGASRNHDILPRVIAAIWAGADRPELTGIGTAEASFSLLTWWDFLGGKRRLGRRRLHFAALRQQWAQGHAVRGAKDTRRALRGGDQR